MASALALSFACSPVVGTPLTSAPINACPQQFPCDAYVLGGTSTRALCNVDPVTQKSRCEYGKPSYPFTIIVDVPGSSVYAPGRVFALTNNDLVAQPGALVNPRCLLSGGCVLLPELVGTEGRYRVTEEAAKELGMPLDSETSIPVRVEFAPFAPGTTTEAVTLGFPLTGIRTTSQRIQKKLSDPFVIAYVDAVSVGGYRRVAYPEPPFDAFFPPISSAIRVTEPLPDEIFLGRSELIDAGADLNRTTTVTRKEGLEGWRVWLADDASLGGRRISAIKTLAGVEATVTLHTVGAGQEANPALRENVDVIIAPPEGSLGVPRLESRIVNGGPFGLRFLDVPPLPAPATFSGVVAQGDGALTGVPSRILFTSTGVRKRDGKSDTTLKYATAVSTDDTGHFATVLPIGFYDVTIEPQEGTGFSKVKETLDTTVTLAKTFRPPPRTVAFGRALLADGRPLSEAIVLAIPSDAPLVGQAVRPRPTQTRTDEAGNFKFEVDQGQFNVMVDPQPGTDFPRVVQLRSFAGLTSDMGEIVVAPPARLAFQLANPINPAIKIARAVVRVFAELPGRGPPALEIGRAMTDDNGNVEILLAQQAR